MGWTYTSRGRGTTHDAWFKQELSDASKTEDGHGLLKVMGGGPGQRAVYGAYRTREGKVIAVVCLIDWRIHDYYNFGYKDMEESMGPCEHDCPRAILEMLSPVSEVYEGKLAEWAQAWRDRCWARINERKARRPLKKGAIVKFAHELQWTSGFKAQEMVCTDPKRLVFAPVKLPAWNFYRIRRRDLEGAEVRYE